MEVAPTSELEQKSLTEWSFDDLPIEFVSKQGGFEVKGFPALVAKKDSVDIKLFNEEHVAREQHQLGIEKLVLIGIPSPVKYLQEKLPNKAKLGLYFNPFGQVKPLIDDCILAGVAALHQQFIELHNIDGDIRELTVFNALQDYVRAELNDTVLTIAEKVENGLTTAHAINKKLKGNVPLNMINAHGDIKGHLNELVFTGCVSSVGAMRLDDWNRYIKGVQRRLEKLPVDPTRDKLQQMEVNKVQQRYETILSKIPQGKVVPEQLKAVKWMLQELRISLFAQQLGTAMPISAKRINNALDEF